MQNSNSTDYLSHNYHNRDLTFQSPTNSNATYSKHSLEEIIDIWKKDTRFISRKEIVKHMIVSDQQFSSQQLYSFFKTVDIDQSSVMFDDDLLPMLKLLIEHRSQGDIPLNKFFKPLRNDKDFFEREEERSKPIYRCMEITTLFRLILNEVYNSGCYKYYKKYHDTKSREKLMNSVYFEDPNHDFKTLRSVSTEMHTLVSELFKIKVSGIVFNQKIFGPLRDFLPTYKDELHICLRNGVQQGDTRQIYDYRMKDVPAVKLISQATKLESMNSDLYPLNKIIDKFGKFLPVRICWQSWIKKCLKNKKSELLDLKIDSKKDGPDNFIAKMLKGRPELISYFNLQLLTQRINNDSLFNDSPFNIIKFNQAILDKARTTPHKGNVYVPALISPADVMLMKNIKNFFNPAIVEGYPEFPDWAAVNLSPWTRDKDSKQRVDLEANHIISPKNLYRSQFNAIFIINTKGTNAAIELTEDQKPKQNGQRACLIAGGSKYQFVKALETLRGLEIHLDIVQDNKEIDEKVWLNIYKSNEKYMKSGSVYMKSKEMPSRQMTQFLNDNKLLEIKSLEKPVKTFTTTVLAAQKNNGSILHRLPKDILYEIGINYMNLKMKELM